MNYTLVKPDGTLGDTRDFAVAPTLSPNKGKWLPDTPPTFNANTHTLSFGQQSVTNTSIIYVLTALNIAVIKAAKLASLEASRDAAIATLPPVTVAGKQYPATPGYREIVSSLARRSSAGRPIPTNLHGADGVPVTLTAPVLGLIDDAMAAAVQAQWDKWGLKHDVVQAALTVDAVNAVVW